MKKEFGKGNYIRTFRQIQSYSHCYPYMDIKFLIHSLVDLWELLCEKNEIIKNQTNSKLSILKADPKTNPDVIKAAMTALDDAVGETNKPIFLNLLFKET